jgi:hypothetical protein
MIVQGAGVIEWVGKINQAVFQKDAVGIGQLRNGKLIAGVVYDNYNGNNIIGAITVSAPPTRQFWWAINSYAFEALGCNRITAYVEEANTKSHNLLKRMGFESEGKMEKAGADGSDITIYRLWKKDCRMLNWGIHHGQESQNAASA